MIRPLSLAWLRAWGWAAAVALLLAGPVAANPDDPPASADFGDTSSLAYFGRPAAPEAGTDAALFWALSTGSTPGDPPLHLRQWLPEGAVLVGGAGEAAYCDGSATSEADYSAKLDELYAATQDLQETDALVSAAVAAQLCLDAVVPAADLAYPSFMMGVNGFDKDDPAVCEEFFSAVFALDVNYEWDRDYHPLVHDCFSDAKVAVVGRARATLALQRAEGTEAWLDGRPWAPETAAVEVLPGRHLLQISWAGEGAVRGVAITVEEGATVSLVDPAVLDAPADETTLGTIPPLLTALERDGASIPTVMIAMDGERPAPWIWDREIDALAEWKPDPSVLRERRKAAIRSNPAVPVLLGAGAAAIAAGAVMTAVSQGELDSLRDEVEAGRMPMAEADDPDATDAQLATRDQWERHDAARAVGIGLMAGGGLSMAVALPVGLVGAKKQREMTLSAGAVLPVRPGYGEREFAVGLTFHIR